MGSMGATLLPDFCNFHVPESTEPPYRPHHSPFRTPVTSAQMEVEFSSCHPLPYCNHMPRTKIGPYHLNEQLALFITGGGHRPSKGIILMGNISCTTWPHLYFLSREKARPWEDELQPSLGCAHWGSCRTFVGIDTGSVTTRRALTCFLVTLYTDCWA